MMNRQQQIAASRAWLAAQLGVSQSAVADEHVLAWERLAFEIRAHHQTEAQARGVRAQTLGLGVTTRRRETSADRHAAEVAKMYGPRQLLEGEVDICPDSDDGTCYPERDGHCHWCDRKVM